MVFFNYSTMQMAAKVVYYGPGLCGKTTNLQYIYSRTADGSRGEMVSLETETDRTLFFDLLPIDVGSIAGFKTRIQLYTVPGQVFYNTTRKLVLKGVDGVVFVADSQRPMLDANVESLKNLEENLAEMNLSSDEIPLVLQYNKRDLADICTVDELNEALNPDGSRPHFESSAITGEGVFETLKGISKLTLVSLKRRLAQGAPGAASTAPKITPPPSSAPKPPPPAPKPAPVVTPAPEPEVVEPVAVANDPVEVAPPEPAKTPTPVPTPAPAAVTPTKRVKAKSTSDVLAELEKIRKQTLSAPASRKSAPGAAGANGRREINREIQMTLSPSDFARAQKFLLQLQVEDSDAHVVDSVEGYEVELGDLEHAHNVVVKINIDLQSE